MMYIKTILIILLLNTLLSYSQRKNDYPTVPVPYPVDTPGMISDNGVLFGTELDKFTPNVPIQKLYSNPAQYENKIINVKGDIVDICQEMGCWVKITEGTNVILIQTLHKFFLPKDASGKISDDGTFKIKEIPDEQAKDILKESKNPDMKEDDINGPQKIFVLEASGIRIFSK